MSQEAIEVCTSDSDEESSEEDESLSEAPSNHAWQQHGFMAGNLQTKIHAPPGIWMSAIL